MTNRHLLYSSIQLRGNFRIGCRLWWLRSHAHLRILRDSRWLGGHANWWPHDRTNGHEPELLERHYVTHFGDRLYHGHHCASNYRPPDTQCESTEHILTCINCSSTVFCFLYHTTLVIDVRMAHRVLDYVHRAYSENFRVHHLGIS